MRFVLAVLALAALAATAPNPTRAENFPSRPVTLIVPWPPGGTTDVHLRALASATEKHLGQPIVIENRPGAAGTLGAATMAATAKPDGYTIAQLPVTIFRLPYMQKVSFDPKKDFTYIIHLTGYLFGVAVRTDSPWTTWRQFLDHAKAHPGQVSYGTPGTGSTLHITMEQIALQEGIKWTQVPFKGQAEQVAALLGNHVTALASGMGLAPQIEANQFRMLVMWTPQRVKHYPDVPTLVEEGQKIVSTSPYGLAGPKGMDPKVVEVLHQAFHKGMKEPAHLELLDRFNMTEEYLGPEDYKRFAMQTIDEQKALIEQLGLGPK